MADKKVISGKTPEKRERDAMDRNEAILKELAIAVGLSSSAFENMRMAREAFNQAVIAFQSECRVLVSQRAIAEKEAVISGLPPRILVVDEIGGAEPSLLIRALEQFDLPTARRSAEKPWHAFTSQKVNKRRKKR